MYLLNSILLEAIHSNQMPDATNTEKFYVVVGVIALLFLGISIYLIRLDKKISKLEKN